jgi:hypothetical protein
MSELDRIWDGDRLSRRNEAKIIQNYLVAETATFRSLGRQESIVLGIDAPYGRGKTWFLERLANQIELSHPVARVNAWTDDAGDEPLTAFMAAIDQAVYFLAQLVECRLHCFGRCAVLSWLSFHEVHRIFDGRANLLLDSFTRYFAQGFYRGACREFADHWQCRSLCLC